MQAMTPDDRYRLRAALAHMRAFELDIDAVHADVAGPCHDVLAGFDAVTARPDPLLIDAARLYALYGMCWPEHQLSWMRYALSASRAVFGENDDRTLHTLEAAAHLHAAQGLTFEAVTLRGQIRDAYVRRGDVYAAARSLVPLAQALHTDGQCDYARDLTRATFGTTLLRAGDQPWRRVAEVALTSNLAILIGCGHDIQAHQLLGEHQSLLGEPGTPRRWAASWQAAITIAAACADHYRVCTGPGPAAHAAVPGQMTAEYWRRVLMDTGTATHHTVSGGTRRAPPPVSSSTTRATRNPAWAGAALTTMTPVTPLPVRDGRPAGTASPRPQQRLCSPVDQPVPKTPAPQVRKLNDSY
jgi:hypothetical protein